MGKSKISKISLGSNDIIKSIKSSKQLIKYSAKNIIIELITLSFVEILLKQLNFLKESNYFYYYLI